MPYPKYPYINRDVSWLSFNYRVLQEAKDPNVPLLERLKFLAIYSNNLGEFFRVRVASNRNLSRASKKTQKKLEYDPDEIIEQIIDIVRDHMIEFSNIFENFIVPELHENGISILRRTELDQNQIDFIEDYFYNHMLPYVQPVLLLKGKIRPFLNNASLYLAVILTDVEAEGKTFYGLVQIPSNYLPRFVEIPSDDDHHNVIIIDDIVRHSIQSLFPGYQIEDAFSIKLTRDAELYIDDEYTGNLLDKIKKSLSKRNVGPASRLVFDRSMPDSLIKYLMDMLDLESVDMIPESRYHNNFDFFSFPDFDKKHIKNKTLKPLPYPLLEQRDRFFENIRQHDHLLMFPYHKYDPVIKFFENAAIDPRVIHIKIVQYRVASKSRIMNALKRAIKNGKKVFAFIEVKARFDEEANLNWGEELEKIGVEVQYSFPGLKVHVKVAQVRRIEGEGWIDYNYLSTGNFHEGTARIYSDYGLFTSDRRITKEVARLFIFLETIEIPTKPFNYLLVGQFNLFDDLIEMIDDEIEAARNGRKAHILLKLNSIQDPAIIKRLYKASRAGVQIQLIIRGICSIVTDDEIHSANIEGISIIDRYLEHARVYYFYAEGKEKLYLSSADWMSRNLHRRIETAFPILDPDLKEEIMDVMKLQWNDNVKGRILDSKFSNIYQDKTGEENIQSQLATYAYYKARVDY